MRWWFLFAVLGIFSLNTVLADSQSDPLQIMSIFVQNTTDTRINFGCSDFVAITVDNISLACNCSSSSGLSSGIWLIPTNDPLKGKNNMKVVIEFRQYTTNFNFAPATDANKFLKSVLTASLNRTVLPTFSSTTSTSSTTTTTTTTTSTTSIKPKTTTNTTPTTTTKPPPENVPINIVISYSRPTEQKITVNKHSAAVVVAVLEGFILAAILFGVIYKFWWIPRQQKNNIAHEFGRSDQNYYNNSAFGRGQAASIPMENPAGTPPASAATSTTAPVAQTTHSAFDDPSLVPVNLESSPRRPDPWNANRDPFDP